jgi:hypothetical protein
MRCALKHKKLRLTSEFFYIILWKKLPSKHQMILLTESHQIDNP